MDFGQPLRAGGRGREYTPLRAILERTLSVLYGDGWPARLWERVPWSTEVTVERLALELLPLGSAELRVAFVSDLHIGPTTPERLLDRAFEILAGMHLEVLLLGGDYVFLEATKERARRLRDLVERVPARTKIAVLGNHDLWTAHPLLEVALVEAGCQLLINDSTALPSPHEDVTIVGLDEPWTGHADPRRALAGCRPGDTRILVCHSPDGFLMVPAGVSLYVAGHTHGGHMALPGGKPIVLPPGPGSRRWPRGLHPFGDGVVYVSRGLGATELPMRTFASPEVSLFTLRARRG